MERRRQTRQLPRLFVLVNSVILAGALGTACSSPAVLITTVEQGPSNRCENGGVLLLSGVDRNGNAGLEPDEIQATSLLCNGVDGQDGTNGVNGTNGTNGTNGIDGEDGYSFLLKQTNVPADPRGACFFGGVRVDAGLDTNRNNILDDAEIADTRFICSVDVNENLTLVDNVQELPGANCEFGGVKTTVGYDDDGDKILDPEEVDSLTYLCSEVIPIPGMSTLVRSEAATPAQCPAGGTLLRFGLDANYNGALDVAEVERIVPVCNGQNGHNSLVSTQEHAANLCGSLGGVEFFTGIDDNDDGILQTREIDNHAVVCDGEQGEQGEEGFTTLISMQGFSANLCGPVGGVVVSSGLDLNRDGFLQNNEVDQQQFVCDSLDNNGFNSLIVTEDGDEFCPSGIGFVVKTGLDTDRDAFLDSVEVQRIEVVCDGQDGQDGLDGRNGLDGLTPVLRFSEEFEFCPVGGVRIEYGLDFNFNGILDNNEVSEFTYICDGQ